MTDYAVDDKLSTLIRTWGTGYGHLAATVTSFAAEATTSQRHQLSNALTQLSAALWRCYTHPASACANTAVNSEGWRRQQTRDAFDSVVAVVQKPNLPDATGLLIVSYDPVVEAAHQLGRVLRELYDAAVHQAVIAEVEAELRAVESAERGDLSGRAAQAVMMSRSDASPAQVAAADTMLGRDPLGGEELLLEFDPTAVAVAAAHWLRAAADVTSELSGIPATMSLQRLTAFTKCLTRYPHSSSDYFSTRIHLE